MARHQYRPEGIRSTPEKIVLEAKDGIPVPGKPPVRIFIGSEAAQHRAERALVWSIEQVRNPDRVYEIYLMKELQGFDRRKWLTGFTNYRFAIPAFAGQTGRAIYNDVDQIYLADPGELFDHDLNGHGFLTIAKNDSSVMLMDCTKMKDVWTLKAAQVEKKKTLLQRALAVPHLWGELEPEWNARDEEYQPERSKLLHFTALHTQPWHPFPDQFVYQHSPEGDIWTELENQANRAGFQLFSRSRPSYQFQLLADSPPATPSIENINSPSNQIERILQDCAAHITNREIRTCLWYHPRRINGNPVAHPEDTQPDRPAVTFYNFWSHTPDSLPADQYDVVYSADAFQHIPDEDVPWILEEMFRLANILVYVHVRAEDSTASTSESKPSRNIQNLFDWWVSHCETISKRYAHIHWKCVASDNREKSGFTLERCGGHWIGHLPRMWILSDGKVGHTTQSEALARLLGWPYEIKHLQFRRWHRLQKVFWGLCPPHTAGVDWSGSSSLHPPWPDIVLNAGWRSVPVARWIRQQHHGHTRIIQLGRKAGYAIDLYDLAITPAYYNFPPHPRRIELDAPLNQLTHRDTNAIRYEWPDLFQNASHPRIALILGGPTNAFSFTPDLAARLAHQIIDLAEQCGGTIFAVTSPRTGESIAEVLEKIFQPPHVLHRWRPGQARNPYLAYLTGADIILITGDSESMLAEAASLEKPVYIIPLPAKPQTWIGRLNDWIIRRAHTPRMNKRGTVRPQQGLERMCAKLMRGGFVQPQRDLTVLHESLIHRGIARRFGEPMQNGTRPRLHEADSLAETVKEKLGIFDRVKR